MIGNSAELGGKKEDAGGGSGSLYEFSKDLSLILRSV